MAKIIDLPKLSPTMEEGTLVRWAKNEGDKIDIDDLLAEVETDKATMEFRAFDRGTLLKRLVAEGAVVKLGAPVAIFGEPGEDVSALTAQAGGGGTAKPAAAKPADDGAKPAGDAAKPPAVKPAGDAAKPPAAKPESDAAKLDSDAAKPAGDAAESAASETESAPAKPEVAEAAAPAPTATKAEAAAKPARGPRTPAPDVAATTPGLPGVLMLPSRPANRGAASAADSGAGAPTSPRVRRLARERGIDLDAVRGTGDHGRITVQDLERGPQRAAPGVAARAGAPAGVVGPRPEDTVRPASQMRKTIARRLTEAKRDVPHFYLEADLDVEALGAMREALNDGVEKDAKISVTDLLLRACALALREVPASNASWADGSILQHNRVDISLAVSIEDGLVTPVLRDVDLKSVRVISAEVKDLAARARSKKLKLEEMQGGVFSLSNLGMYGVDRFSAVINPPEGMILAVGATRDTPVVRDGAVVPGKRCAVTLSCDHRVVDGALGAQFLKALRALVERPIKILA